MIWQDWVARLRFKWNILYLLSTWNASFSPHLPICVCLLESRSLSFFLLSLSSKLARIKGRHYQLYKEKMTFRNFFITAVLDLVFIRFWFRNCRISCTHNIPILSIMLMFVMTIIINFWNSFDFIWYLFFDDFLMTLIWRTCLFRALSQFRAIMSRMPQGA